MHADAALPIRLRERRNAGERDMSRAEHRGDGPIGNRVPANESGAGDRRGLLCTLSLSVAMPQMLAAAAKNGAGDRDRTDDIQLGKLTFYH